MSTPAVIISFHGIKITALVQLWSVTVSTKSETFDSGNLMMKSIATVLNGSALGFVNMGLNGAFIIWLFALFHWQSVHPLT